MFLKPIYKGSVNRSYFLNKGDEIDVLSTENSNYGYIAIKNGILTSSFEGSFEDRLERTREVRDLIKARVTQWLSSDP